RLENRRQTELIENNKGHYAAYCRGDQCAAACFQLSRSKAAEPGRNKENRDDDGIGVHGISKEKHESLDEENLRHHIADAQRTIIGNHSQRAPLPAEKLLPSRSEREHDNEKAENQGLKKGAEQQEVTPFFGDFSCM